MCGDEDFVYKLLFNYIFMNLFPLWGNYNCNFGLLKYLIINTFNNFHVFVIRNNPFEK